MHLSTIIDPAFIFSGFLVGTLVGMTGVGGGSLMTPLLVLVFGIHPTTAVGTDLLFAAVTKTVGTAVHGANATVDWRITRRLATGSIPATIATLLVLSQVNPLERASHLISTVLGVALILTALALLLRRQITRFAERRIGEPSPVMQRNLTILTGLVLGVLVSLSSVGAGALGVTVLLILYPRSPLVRLVGSDIAHAVPLTLIAGIGHWLIGSVDLRLLSALLVGSIPGIFIGSHVSSRLPETILRPILAATLLLVGSKLAI